MAQRPVLTGILAFAAVLSVPAWAAPILEGRFEGPLGVLRLQTEAGGRVTGQVEAGAACSWLIGQTVLEGHLEGNVFAGRVFVCQTGPSCTSRSYPVLAIVDQDDKTLSARVKLEVGCQSPALKSDGALVLTPVSEAARPTSAAHVARGKLDRRRVEKADRAYQSAVRMATARQPDLREARQLAEEATSIDQSHWKAYLLRGGIEMRLNNPDAAVQSYSRAQALNPRFADTYFKLASAHARLQDRALAMENLKMAVDRGFRSSEDLTSDPDLSTLFALDPEFRALAEKIGRTAQNGRRLR